MFKIKILVIGPCQSGKTVLSNFLADATEASNGEYNPTQGVRILEFESNSTIVGGKPTPAEIELWDCSGSEKFESCWPAIMKDTQGILFVYNPDQPNHQKELEKFYGHFVQSQGVRDTQCIMFVMRKSKLHSGDLPQSFGKIPIIDANLENDGESVRNDFNKYINRLLNTIYEKRDQEELIIMNS